MAALFHAGSRKYGQDLMEWLLSMMTIEILPAFSRYVPVRIQRAYFHSPKRRFRHGIASDNSW